MLMLDESSGQRERPISISRRCCSPCGRAIGRSLSAQLNDRRTTGRGSRISSGSSCRPCGAAGAGARARRPLHGQARQRDLADQSRDPAQPRRAMGLRDRPAALSRQHLYRRRHALGGVRLGRQRHQDRRRGVLGRSQERPLRRDQCQSGDRAARPRYSGLAARGVRPQRSRHLSGGARRRPDRCRRCGDLPRRCRRSAGAAFPAAPVDRGPRRFICRGCYFIYDEAHGCRSNRSGRARRLPIFPATWRCPDCGTDKTTFRPYVEKAAAGGSSLLLAYPNEHSEQK